MRPTAPLILLTVLQGLAWGLIATVAWWLPSATASQLGFLTDLERLGSLLAAAGGVASFFHMHRPQAARYILRRLGTSWLSREALTTGLFVAVLTAVAWTVGAQGPGSEAGAIVSAGLGTVAVGVTALLYATIPAMRSWHSPVTVLALMGTGLVSGEALALGLAAVGPGASLGRLGAPWLLAGILGLTLVKGLQLHQFQLARDFPTGEGASGLPRGPWRLQDTGTSRPPYRTQPQVWPLLPHGVRVAGYTTVGLTLLALPAAGALAAVAHHGALAALGGISAAVGAVAERWMFFADATHSSRIWFQDVPRAPSRVAGPTASPEWVREFLAAVPPASDRD
ncbi:MAG: dimethyl sulfoxide reductase anchor subunit [Firmicutes bacterium]|nr:dimethyl sulfoxide reductase anchor subunit [Alicyclobacillaceae bacterium]MCL6497569.1 dimethyl sulfoxide reductase anchor subunit [Bacillota bacterium]